MFIKLINLETIHKPNTNNDLSFFPDCERYNYKQRESRQLAYIFIKLLILIFDLKLID